MITSPLPPPLLFSRLAADVSKTNNAVLSDVISRTLKPGVYEFSAYLFVAQLSNNAVFTIDGTVIAPLFYYDLVQPDGAQFPLRARRITAKGQTSEGAYPYAGDTSFSVYGAIEVSVAGTLAVQIAQKVADANTVTVKAGSYFNFWKL